MTPTEIDQTIAGVRAWLEGKPVQYRALPDGEWFDAVSAASRDFITVSRGTAFRPKPEPKLRPWKADEVPIDHWFREKAVPEKWFRIDSVWFNLDGGAFVSFPRGSGTGVNTVSLRENYEHSASPLTAWHACEIKETP